MANTYFMGIDVGTYETKGVIIDENYQVVSTQSVAHGMENPKPGHFEHDAEEIWWGDVCKVSKALLADSGVNNKDIACMGISCCGANLVPVDENIMPLRMGILYGIDSRAAEKEFDEIYEQYGREEVLKFNGRPLVPNDIPPKIRWIQNNEPEVYEKTYKFLTGSSFITAKLTGKFVIDRFLGYGGFTPLYDPEKGTIDDRYVNDFCRPDQLAELHDNTDVVGTITAEAAEKTGLAEGTPVITGADDSGAEAISTGILEVGDFMVQIGSTLYFIGIADHLAHDPRIWSGGFLIPNTNSVQGGTNTAGTFTRWFRDNFFEEALKAEEAGGPNAYDAMLEGLDEIPIGSDGLIALPYLAGERTPINDPLAKGVFFGLTMQHTKKHMYRAVLESIAYSIADHFEIFKENDAPPKRVFATGGGLKSPLWMQIIADVTGLEIHTPGVGVGASYGDALMAAIGVGHLESFAKVRDYITEGETYVPNMENHEKYQKYLNLYRKLYEDTKDIAHDLP